MPAVAVVNSELSFVLKCLFVITEL